MTIEISGKRIEINVRIAEKFNGYLKTRYATISYNTRNALVSPTESF